MFKNVFTKSLYSLRWQLLGWTVGVMAIAFITMILYPSFSQAGIENVVNSVPDSLKSLVGDVADFKTIPGYIGQQIFGPNLYIIALIMAILVFLGTSAGEESDGRLQTLLSFPLSRTQVYFQKLFAAGLVITVVSCSVFVALLVALLALGEPVYYGRIWQSVFDFVLLNLAYGSITYAAAMFTGSKGWSVLLASGYAVASFFISSLAPAVDKLQTVEKLSLLHYYNNPQIMTHGLHVKHVLVLVFVTVLLAFVGWLGFIRRDVRAS